MSGILFLPGRFRMNRLNLFSPWLSISTVLVFVFLVAECARSQESWEAGVAKSDITPKEAVRLSGYAARSKPTSEVDDRLHVRAMYLKHSSNPKPLLLISIDAIGVAPWMTKTISEQIQKDFGIARAQMVICTTHSHTAPHIDGALNNLFSGPLTDEEKQATQRYTKELVDSILATTKQAVANAKPAKVSYVLDRAEFAINRRKVANSQWTGFGTVDDGPVDRNVRIIRVDDLNHQPIAVAYQYACHCTSISADLNRISADWAGISASQIESAQPNVIALPVIGAGADANPNPRGTYELAKQHGMELGAAVLRGLAKPSKTLPPPETTSFAYTGLEFERPSRSQLQESLQSKSFQEQNRARYFLDLLKRKDRIPESYPAPVHLWTFGKELAWVFLGGEVVVDYQIRLERELNQFSNVWVAGYTDDVFAYVASERVRKEGGYEVDSSMIYYNQPGPWVSGTEDKLVRSILDLQRQTRSLEEPLHAAEGLRSIQVPAGWKVEQLAAEPLVEDPVNISFGADGKVWVVEMGDYPNGGKSGRVKWLQDVDGDGTLDKSVIFLDGLEYPAGVYAWRDGAVVACAPEIFFARDTDGDGKADERRTILSGFPLTNPQHRVHGFTYGLDHKLYFGTGSDAKVVTLHQLDGSRPSLDIRGADLAVDVDKHLLTLESGETQFIRSQNAEGQWFGNDNTHPIYQFIYDRNWFQPNGPRPRNLDQQLTNPASSPEVYPLSQPLDRFNDPNTANRFTSVCSTIFVASPGCDEEMQGAAIVCESVHNLVARFKMDRDGLAWKATRFPDEQLSDWVRSSDPWFRPVRVVNAPDGTIWIVDMYRRVIEHPTWIPEEWMARLDVRAGDDRGRIYRVFKNDYRPNNRLRMSGKSLDELIGLLGNPSAGVADLAQQQIIWNFPQAFNLTSSLANGLQRATTTNARIRCFSILAYLERLDAATWNAVLHHSDGGLVSYALHHLSRLPELPVDILPQIDALLVSDLAREDARVAKELIYLAGNQRPDQARKVVDLLSAHRGIRGIDTLVDFIGNDRIDGLVASLLDATDDQLQTSLDRLMPRVSPQGQTRFASSIESVRSDRPSWHYRLARQLAIDPKTASILKESTTELLSQQAKSSLSDTKISASVRMAAFDYVLARMSDADDVSWLLEIAKNSDENDWVNRVIDGVFRLGTKTHPQLLSNLADASPAARNAIVSVLVSQPKAALLLLDQIESNRLPKDVVQPSQLEYLRNQKDSELGKRVLSIYGKDESINRAELIADYVEKWPVKTDLEAGKKLFVQHCASCHQERMIQGEKVAAIGPSLEALNHWTNDLWVVSILDPSRSVDSKYRRVLIRTDSEEVIAGLKVRETEKEIEIITTDGRIQNIARNSIQEEKESILSLMPDGFEKSLSPQQMADIVRYLRSSK